MTSARTVYLSSPQPFPFDDECRMTAAIRWPKWLSDFELYIEASAIGQAAQQKALLLYTAGEAVRNIYNANGDGTESLADTKTLLNNYFSPLKNVDLEIFNFSRMYQTEYETVDDFAERLREAAKRCGYDENATKAEVKKQIIAGCESAKLRQHILETTGITLD